MQYFVEHENQNSNRRYPFEDNVSLQDTAGNALPADFLVDAVLHPVEVTGAIYLAEINQESRTLLFKSELTDAVVGTATYELDQTTAAVYMPTDIVDAATWRRQAGMVVFGAGLQNLVLGGVVRKFTAAATRLCAAAVITLNHGGVRGIYGDLKNMLLTGDVLLVTEDGVRITARYEPIVEAEDPDLYDPLEEEPELEDPPGPEGSFRRVIRVDVLGVRQSSADNEDCEDLGPLVTTLVIHRKAHSAFDVNLQGPNVVAVRGNGFDADDICAREANIPDENGKLPNKLETFNPSVHDKHDAAHPLTAGNDPCSDNVLDRPRTPYPRGAEIFIPLTPVNGSWAWLHAPNDVGYRNPVFIGPGAGGGGSMPINLPKLKAGDDPPKIGSPSVGGSLVIGLKIKQP